MCGFAYVYRKDKEPKDIPQDLLFHRGPDYNNQIRLPNTCLRHWRLSIVDLSSKSNQPLHDDKFVFVYNGEIYNYLNLGKEIFNKNYTSDTKLFFDLLKGSNEDILDVQSGFYSYLLINKADLIMKGGRDFFGKKNLFYYFDNNLACFASEEKAIKKILTNEGKKISLSKSAFIQYLEYKDLFFGKTFYDGIKEIPPGSKITFDPKSWKLEISNDWKDYYYSDLRDTATKKIEKVNLKVSNFNENIEDQVVKAIECRMNCDVDVQIALSGGVDSSLISAILKNKNYQKKILKSINVGFEGDSDESQKALITANSFKFKHELINFKDYDFLNLLEQSINSYGSPLSHPHSLAYDLLTKQARKEGKVLITGEGADELFWGYNHYQGDFKEGFAFRQFINIKKFLKKEIVFDEEERMQIENLRKRANENIFNSQDLEMKTHLLSLLRRNDKISMSNSIEIRSPFIDINILHLINTLKASESRLINKKVLKDILKKYNPSYKGDIKKIGFYVPFDEWFNINKEKKVLKNILSNAIDFYEDFLGAHLFNKKIDNKFGWILLNTGIFIKNL